MKPTPEEIRAVMSMFGRMAAGVPKRVTPARLRQLADARARRRPSSARLRPPAGGTDPADNEAATNSP